MNDGEYLDTAHSPEERDRKVKEFEKLLKKRGISGKIVAEFRRVKFTPQWDIYYKK